MYVRDYSPIGNATKSRTTYSANRLCEYKVVLNCPGQEHGLTVYPNGTGSVNNGDSSDAYISSQIPKNISDIFSSASLSARGNVAGALDIEYRSFIVGTDPDTTTPSIIDQGRPRTQGRYQTYNTLLLNDRYDVIEGLVVDSKTGGIGFRNHTMPADPALGAEWTEGLLWLQPETACVSANLSFDYRLDNTGSPTGRVFTDRGGFAKLTESYPEIDLTDPQSRPELLARAYKAAVLNNYNLMTYFKVSRDNTSVGKTFQFSNANSTAGGSNRIYLDRFLDQASPLLANQYVDVEYSGTDSGNSTKWPDTGYFFTGESLCSLDATCLFTD